MTLAAIVFPTGESKGSPFSGLQSERMIPDDRPASEVLRPKCGELPHKATATVGTRRLSLTSTEKGLTIQVRVALAAMPGVCFWRNNVGVDLNRGVRYGLAVGSGDLVGMIDGQFASIELKTSRGRPTDAQKRWMALIIRRGGAACIARSVEEVVAFVSDTRANRRRVP